MNFFKKPKRQIPSRFSENSQGDFYVEDGSCISCGAPQAEAPDLIDHSKFDNHCYFKKQPETDDEIEQAIQAIAVSCCAGLRYSGLDEKILKRLYEIGQSEQCDHEPIGHYKTLIWNRAIFRYDGSTRDLAELLAINIVLGDTHLNKHIVDFSAGSHGFEFIYRWTSRMTGTIFRCDLTSDNKFQIYLSYEKDGNELSIRRSAMDVNSILSLDNNVSEIIWFDKDNNTYNHTELR